MAACQVLNWRAEHKQTKGEKRLKSQSLAKELNIILLNWIAKKKSKKKEKVK
jgi:hypothetical protein